MKGLRVRFAPSPTGQLHVGNARTALFNFLLAERHGGSLILRIEDTDRERSSRESEHAIMQDLRWLGITWHEGPDVGGPHEPYRQSERAARYRAAVEELLARGRAYHCFCSPDMLEADRQASLAAGVAPKYSGRCRQLDRSDVSRRMAEGEPAAIRFAVPKPDRPVAFSDLVRGEIAIASELVGDFVIVRSEGGPAFHFAVVVDDAAMGVTHVVRGEDHISNTPRQILLYEALGLTPPAFAHLSLVLGPDHAPLSKRHGATSVAEFRARGFLPEALANYLALLGWSPGHGEEIVPIAEMASRFELSRVTHSAAVFDTGKLEWMNREYMKSASPARLADLSWAYFEKAGHVRSASRAARAYVEETLLPMAVGAVDRLEQLPARVSFVFDWSVDETASRLAAEPDAAKVIAAFASVAADEPPFLDKDNFRRAASIVRERSGAKGRALFHPIRVALTGLESGPELDLAIPAIDRGAALDAAVGVKPVLSCRERARQLALRLR